MTPQCTICGECSAAPLRRLPAEEREGWAAVGGQPVHRRCAVARKLEEARLEKERASYRRIRKEVYALPREALHASQGNELHRIGSGREWSSSGGGFLVQPRSIKFGYFGHHACLHLRNKPWSMRARLKGRLLFSATQALTRQGVGAAADSFRRPYVPASPLARLSTQQQQQQLELLEQAVEQQAAQQAAEQQSAEGQPDVQGAQPQVAPQASPEHLLPSKGDDSHPSPQDVLPAGEHSHDSLALSSRSSSGAAVHPALLRQTSPVRHAALMETKSIRRRSLQRPSFDGWVWRLAVCACVSR